MLTEHRAYWPFEFDNASQQPMETLEPYRSLALRVGNLPDRAEAAVAAKAARALTNTNRTIMAENSPSPRERPRMRPSGAFGKQVSAMYFTSQSDWRMLR